MYYEKINNNILSIIRLFIFGCNYQVLNPPNNSNSSNNSNEGNNNGSNEDNFGNGSENNSGENNSGEDNDNSENITKTMYFKFKISGKSSQEAFNKNDIFPKKILMRPKIIIQL